MWVQSPARGPMAGALITEAAFWCGSNRGHRGQPPFSAARCDAIHVTPCAGPPLQSFLIVFSAPNKQLQSALLAIHAVMFFLITSAQATCDFLSKLSPVLPRSPTALSGLTSDISDPRCWPGGAGPHRKARAA